jgi:hypothetical protein
MLDELQSHIDTYESPGYRTRQPHCQAEFRAGIDLHFSKSISSSVPLVCSTRTLPITIMKPSSPASAFTLPHIFILLLCLPLALAQFGNFFQQGFPFGNQHHQQQQPQDGGRAHKGWQEMDSGMSSHRLKHSSTLLRLIMGGRR